MLVTKEEALNKWCPMARVVIYREKTDGTMSASSSTPNRGEVNGHMKILKSSLCIGERCMMFTKIPPPKAAKGKIVLNKEDLYCCGLQQ